MSIIFVYSRGGIPSGNSLFQNEGVSGVSLLLSGEDLDEKQHGLGLFYGGKVGA